MKVIKVEDLIKSIEILPDCPNGHSDAYDKSRILLQIKKIPQYEILESNIVT